MESLEGMRVFTRVVQTGSLSAAGRVMGLSPASISRKISLLEDAVGARLINRTSRKLALTKVGQVYFEKVCTILEQVDALSDTISEEQASPRGLLAVHTRPIIAGKFLSPALPGFLLRYPDITLRLTLNDETPSLIDDKLDVSIRIGAPEEPSLIMRRLSQGVERVLYASPSYLGSRAEIRVPEDLLQHNCLSFPIGGGPQDGQSVWYYRDSTGIRELKVKGSLVANDANLLHSAVVAGIGVGLLPAWLIADDLSFGRVRRILPQYELTTTGLDHGFYAVFAKPQMILPKVRVFVDFLVETFRKFEPELMRMTMDAKRHSAEVERRPPDALRWVSRR
jgi:DNA-binding transcriptional LysR family regulator